MLARVGSGADEFTVLVSSDGGVLKATASSPSFRVPLAGRPAAARALAVVNATLSEGTAELDVADGELRFRVSLPQAPAADLAPLARHVLRTCIAGYPPLLAQLEPLARAAAARRPADAELEAAAAAVADGLAARLALAV